MGPRALPGQTYATGRGHYLHLTKVLSLNRTRKPHCRLTIDRTAPMSEDILNQGTAQYLSKPLIK